MSNITATQGPGLFDLQVTSSGGGGSAPGSGAVARYDGPGLVESILGPVLEAFEPEAGA